MSNRKQASMAVMCLVGLVVCTQLARAEAPLPPPVLLSTFFHEKDTVSGVPYYTTTFLYDYPGSGPVTLSADPWGTRYTYVADVLTIEVTGFDGVVRAFSYNYGSPPSWLEPYDISAYFCPGVNQVVVYLTKIYPPMKAWSTDLWLSANAPGPASLPSIINDGVQVLVGPTGAWWPSADIKGPGRGVKISLAGDARGDANTWAADAVIITVTWPDGTAHSFEYTYLVAGQIVPLPPTDITRYFSPTGINKVDVAVRKLSDGPIASSEMWLVSGRQKK